MSGGSLDYAYCKVADAADAIRSKCNPEPDPDWPESPMDPVRWEKLQAFAAHLDKVADALHDIEWVLSGDTSPGDEFEAIDHALGLDSEALVQRLLAAQDCFLTEVDNMERVIANRDRGKGGQQVTETGDFVYVQPSVAGRLRWHARNMRRAADPVE